MSQAECAGVAEVSVLMLVRHMAMAANLVKSCFAAPRLVGGFGLSIGQMSNLTP